MGRPRKVVPPEKIPASKESFKGERGGNNAHKGSISIRPGTVHLSPLGQSKEIVMPSDTHPVTPATEYRVIEVAKMITEGKSKQTCLEHIQEAQGCGLQQARYYYQAALNWLIPDDLPAYKQGLLQANLERLESIVEDCIKKKDDKSHGSDFLRVAKDAIAEMNKVLGVGHGRVVVAENADGDKAIEISFS